MNGAAAAPGRPGAGGGYISGSGDQVGGSAASRRGVLQAAIILVVLSLCLNVADPTRRFLGMRRFSVPVPGLLGVGFLAALAWIGQVPS